MVLQLTRCFKVFVFVGLFVNIICLAGTEKKSSSKRTIVNRVVAFVDGTKILQSDLEMPRIARDGGKYELDDLIFELAMVKKASERHVLPLEADVDRQVVAFKIQNNLGDISDSDFETYLKPYGFTTRLYKEQIGCLLAVENLKRMEIADKIVITSQEVEARFNSDPKYSPEEYHLKMIPIKKKTDNDFIDLGWIKREELDKKFHFVFKMKKGEVSESPVKINEKEYFVEVVDKKERKKITLSERYGEIERALVKEQMDKEMKNFKGKLMSETTVEIIDPIK